MSPFVFYLIILTAINDHYHELFHWGLQNVHNLILLFLLHLLVGILLKRTFSFQLLSYSEIISTQSHIKRLNYFCLFTSIQNELVPSILQSWPESLFSIVMDFNILICFNHCSLLLKLPHLCPCKPLQVDSCFFFDIMPIPLIAFLLCDKTRYLGSFGTFSSPVMESIFSPIAPSFFWWEMVFRDFN